MAISRSQQVFETQMKEAGLLRKSETDCINEKIAEDDRVTKMRENFLKRAEKAIFEQVTAAMYQDPLLTHFLDAGQFETATKIATGRYGTPEVLDKIAAMDVEEFQQHAVAGLKSIALQKIAAMEEEAKKPFRFEPRFSRRSE